MLKRKSAFAKQIYPSNFVPSPCHRWIKMLEDRGVVSMVVDDIPVECGLTVSSFCETIPRISTRSRVRLE